MLFFILGYFLPVYPFNSPKNQNFEKMKKNTHTHLKVPSFFTFVLKIMNILCTVPEIWCATDRRIDEKSDIGVGAQPKNCSNVVSSKYL